MKSVKTIQVFEHEILKVDGSKGFKQKHFNALLKLNDLHKNKYFTPTYKGIKFNQYVGVLQTQGLTIEIHPKADKYDSDDKWKTILIPMLKACGKLKVKNAGNANLRKQPLNLLEIYFEKYLTELNILLHQGLVKQYRKNTTNVTTLKGKLEFAGNLRKNIVNKERFYTTHQVYNKDHLLHQILYKALKIVGSFTKGTYLYDLVKRIEFQFPEQTSKNISAKDLEKIKLDRKSTVYKEALDLAKLIILNYSPDLSGGKQEVIALLFDMNNLWENFVLKQLQKHALITKGMKVYGQESKKFIENHTLRPDIRISIANKDYIIDTKWKIPTDDKASVQDLRQMYTYARFWNTKKAILLYPGDKQKSKSYQSFLNTNDYPDSEENHQCKIGFISVISSEINEGLNSQFSNQILELLEKE